jgi:hypothetical protein
LHAAIAVRQLRSCRHSGIGEFCGDDNQSFDRRAVAASIDHGGYALALSTGGRRIPTHDGPPTMRRQKSIYI